MISVTDKDGKVRAAEIGERVRFPKHGSIVVVCKDGVLRKPPKESANQKPSKQRRREKRAVMMAKLRKSA